MYLVVKQVFFPIFVWQTTMWCKFAVNNGIIAHLVRHRETRLPSRCRLYSTKCFFHYVKTRHFLRQSSAFLFLVESLRFISVLLFTVNIFGKTISLQTPRNKRLKKKLRFNNKEYQYTFFPGQTNHKQRFKIKMKFVVTGIQVYVVASRMNPTITRSNLVLVFHKNISHVGGQ